MSFSAVGVVGDYFLKLASQQETPLRNVWFAGLILALASLDLLMRFA